MGLCSSQPRGVVSGDQDRTAGKKRTRDENPGLPDRIGQKEEVELKAPPPLPPIPEPTLANSNAEVGSGNDNNAVANNLDDDEDSLDPLNEFVSTNLKQPTIEEEESNSDGVSLDGVELFDLGPPLPPPKKQFLEAAMHAKSLSDLNYVHATEPSEASKWKSMTDLKYDGEDNSLGDNELFEHEEPIPTKKKFLDAALAAKSITDLNFVFAVQTQEEGTKDQGGNNSSDSLGGLEVFQLGAPIVRPKKQFLEAAIMAKSMTDLNYVHSGESLLPRTKSMTDLKFADDQSLGDNDLFELELSVPRPKKQFLEAALAAKSISDLNFVFSAPAEKAPVNQDSNISNTGSLGSVELFELDSPIVLPKKKFLEAAFHAKSLSNINYLDEDEAPQRRRKSLTDLKFADEQSLGDNELFEAEEPVATKKQFLDAALAAKSISDLNFVFSAAAQEQAPTNQDSNDSSSGSLGSLELFGLEAPVTRPKKKAAFMAKSMSDFNYVHSAKAPMAVRRKSLTDLTYDDDRSVGFNELFDQDDTPVVRPKKQFLEAALMAKSISDLKIMYLNKSTYSSSVGSESRDDTSNVVPEHLLGLSQPYLFHSSDLHSIDNDELFESLTEDQPTERPILKAALEAKAQQQEGIVVVGSRDAPTALSSDNTAEIVPEHLVVVNQPATDHAHDNYSIEVEDIFERAPTGDQNTSKPLLKAALEAQAQLEDEEFAEEFAKSMSYLGAEKCLGGKSLSTYHEFSRSVPDFSRTVPDHLAVVHQPTNALPTLDETSIDGDRLFDSPEPKARNSLLEAALRAKNQSKKFEISRSELRYLKEQAAK